LHRLAAVGALAVVLIAALVVLLVAAANDRSTVAFTNEVPSSAEVASVAPGGVLCQHVTDVPEESDGVSVPLYSGQVGASFRLEVRDARSGRTLGAGDGATPEVPNSVAIPTGTISAGRPLDVCIENTSSRRVGIYGVGEGDRRVFRGTVRNGPISLVFFDEQGATLLDRIPEALQRAELFKPAWVGAWTFWVFAVLAVVAIPALLGIALWRSLLGSGPPPTPEARYASFRSEVEPRLIPRVHRFAAPPLIAEPGSPAEPLAVCVEPGDGDLARTRASLDRQSHPPTAVIEGPVSEALGRTTAAWLAVMREGDELAPHALARLGQCARLAPDSSFITCDEDELDGRGGREHPRLRPGPSPDLLLARDLTSSLVCLRRDAVGSIGNGAWRYQAALTMGGPAAAGLAHVPAVLCHSPAPTRDPDGEARAVRTALGHWGQGGARVEEGPEGRRVRRSISSEPSVEVIVPFRDGPQLLQRCATSVLERTTYENIWLTLVDNGSQDPRVTDVLRHLERDPRVRCTRDLRPFNFAALNNAAAAASKADYLLFLNNDTQVLTPSWIEDLLEEAQRVDVGAVAPLLLYPDGTVQHAGAVLGMHEYAGHPFAGLAPDEATPFGAATDGTRNWLAVTAACMLLEHRKFKEVGGFDESFVVAGNDVDLCLRLTDAGYRSLFVPHVRLQHDESRSRGAHIDPGDFARSQESYGAFRTVGDPFYNPNLTLTRTDCGPRLPGEL
jgi:GT2 family glycosyltransferase